MLERFRWFVGCTVVLVLAATAATSFVPTSARAVEPEGGKFVAVSPFRLVDTVNNIGGTQGRLGAGLSRDYQVLGVSGIPSSGVSAVVVDIAALSLLDAPTSSVRVYASDGVSPAAGVVRIEEGSSTRSNTVIAAVGADGKIRVRNAAGLLHFNLDVQGYFTVSGDGSGFVPIAPTRMISTANGTGVPLGQLPGGATHDVQITGDLVPTGATAIFANVLVGGAEVNSGLRLSEGGVTTTGPASVNYRAGVWSDSGLTIKLSGTGQLRISNLATGNDVGVAVDVQGYFMPTAESNASTYTPLDGAKVYDSAATALAAGQTRTITIANQGGLPGGDQITAAALTIHALSWTATGSLVVYPADIALPTTSNVSFNNNSNPTVGLMSTSLVDVSTSGQIKVKNTSTGPVRVILYAQGWFGPTNIDSGDVMPPVPVTSMAPCDGVCTTWGTDTATPTFTAGAAIPGTKVEYRFEVRDHLHAPVVNKTLARTEDQSVSWLVPVGSIKISGTYEVRVTAVNGTAQRSTTWKPFQVTIPASTPTQVAIGTSINSDVVWTPQGSPYIVTGAVSVHATGSLTMQPGTVVKFSGLQGTITVRGGRLTAKGTANRPIIWTSTADDSILGDSTGDGSSTSPAAGNYMTAVKFVEESQPDNPRQAVGVIENVAQRFGGDGSGSICTGVSYSAVYVNDRSQVRIRNSEFMFNEKLGVGVRAPADVSVENSHFSGGLCGVSTSGSGNLIDNVFDGQSSASIYSVDPGDNILQTFSGNWLMSGLGYAAPATRDQIDVRDNYIGLYFHMASESINGGQDLRYNFWDPLVQYPGGCWGGSPPINLTHPKQADFTAPECYPGTTRKISGWVHNVAPFSPKPPFPVAGLEGSPVTLQQVEAMYGSGGDFVNRGDGEQSDPVNSRSGNYVDHVSDAALPAVGVPVVLQRTYNSLDSTIGDLGRGWSMSFGQRLELESTNAAVFVSEEGQRVRFTKTNGAWVGERNVTATLSQDAIGYTVTSREQLKFRFDTTGQLVSIKDRNNEGVQIGRNAQGRVSQIANGTRSLSLTYNSLGRLETVTLPDNRTVQYGYTNGLLTSVTDTGGKTTTYGYDSIGRLEWEKDPRGKTAVKLAYDPTTGRVSDQWDALNQRSQFVWDPVKQTSTVIDPRGGKWVDEYDDGVLFRRVDPLGRAWVYDYDAKLQLITAVDPRGQATRMTYDAAGDMTASSGPNGRVETTFNSRHDPVQATNAKGVVTTFTYDAGGNLKGTSRAAAGELTLSDTSVINARGLIDSVTNTRGHTTSYEYNAAGDLTKTTTPNGRITTHTYDTAGRLKTTTSPAGNASGATPADHTVTYDYNGNDQVTTTTHPTVGTTTTTYDDAGRTTAVTDSRNRTFSYTYDDAGHTLTVQGPDPAIPATTSTYDSVGNLKTQTDPAGRIVTYNYDLASQVTSAVGPSGTYLYTYEPGGRMATARRSGDLSAATTDFLYNVRGLLTKVDYGDSGTPDVTYTYDRHGNRTTMTDGAGVITYTYDTYDRLKNVAQTGGTGGRPAFGYEYDKAGNITRTTGPNGNLTYAYTADGLLDTVATNPSTPSGAPAKQLADYDYGPLGLPTHAALGNNTTWDRSYDPLGRLTKLTHKNVNGATILDETYTRDAAGNPKTITRNAGAANEQADTYTYDTLDRLTAVCYQTTTCTGATDYVRWTYDNVGNRLTEARPAGTTTLSYASATGYLQSATGPTGTTAYTYDKYGRLASTNQTPTSGPANSTTYTYTESNLIKSATNGSNTENYAYDGDSRRLSLTTPAATTKFAWDPNSYLLVNQTETPTGAGSTVSTSYQYGVGALSYTTGDPAASTAAYNYAHTDPQGSIRATTGADGLVDRTNTWEPYGLSRSATNPDPAAPSPRLGWAGEVTNPNGTTHLRARNYDPATGAFTTPDPAVSTSASATYTYAGANPMTGADPYGLFLDGLIDGVRQYAPVVATVAGAGAMVPTPLSPVLGGISLLAGLTTTAVAAYDAYNVCTSGKGGCGPAIMNAALNAAFTLPGIGALGRGIGPARTSARSCSFAGPTVVLMADGTRKPIEDVRVGDLVIATDPETGEQTARRVNRIFAHRDTVIRLQIDGEVLTTTEDHPFWSASERRFKRADQFATGERLLRADGTIAVASRPNAAVSYETVAYNLAVEGLHTYHVGAADVLVHNTCSITGLRNRDHLPTAQALDKAEQFLGQGYRQVGPGRFVSADGRRQVRMTDSDVAPRGGGHKPHMNFETWAKPVTGGGRNKKLDNMHIYLPEEFR